MPTAEHEVTADLVRRLVAAQHPDLARLPVKPLANGWDNALFRLGDELVARLPRRTLGAHIVLNEQRWLPVVAPRLPLPVPVPVRTGEPGEGYPWPWSVTAFLPGTPAADGAPFDPARAAADLGTFFGRLHAPAPPDAPANPYRGVPLADRGESLARNLELLAGPVDRAAVLAAWAAALAVPPWGGPPLWLHGDPHPANILIRDGAVSGVLDFGDITAGDPAADLSLAWMLLPPGWHGDFRAAYARTVGSDSTAGWGGPGARRDAAGDDTWARARGWAVNLAVVFLAWSADNPRLHAVGRQTLAAALAPVAS
jgi:aminoglycoside phosphotransferase (APT) family kinase protein